MAGLEPCPNPWIKCVGGQKPVCTHKDFDGNSELYHVVCHNCGLHGPVMSSKDKAIEAWNRRTPAHSDDAIERAREIALPFLSGRLHEEALSGAIDGQHEIQIALSAITAERERYAGIVEAAELVCSYPVPGVVSSAGKAKLRLALASLNGGDGASRAIPDHGSGPE